MGQYISYQDDDVCDGCGRALHLHDSVTGAPRYLWTCPPGAPVLCAKHPPRGSEELNPCRKLRDEPHVCHEAWHRLQAKLQAELAASATGRIAEDEARRDAHYREKGWKSLTEVALLELELSRLRESEAHLLGDLRVAQGLSACPEIYCNDLEAVKALGLDEASKRAAWEGALKVLREQGLDPDEVVKRAAANLTGHHESAIERARIEERERIVKLLRAFDKPTRLFTGGAMNCVTCGEWPQDHRIVRGTTGDHYYCKKPTPLGELIAQIEGARP